MLAHHAPSLRFPSYVVPLAILPALLAPFAVDAHAESATATRDALMERGIDPHQSQRTRFRRAAGDQFGFATAIDGDLAAVGAPLDDGAGADAGAVYFLERLGGVWVLSQISHASGASDLDEFGFSLSMDGDVVAVGVPGDDARAGSVRVFRLSGGTWIEEQTLTASVPEPGATFGHAVSVDGNRILVGAPRRSMERGQAYIFEYESGVWVQDEILYASDGEWGDYFGFSVSLGSGVALVGAAWGNTDSGLTGSAYVYRYDGFNWPEEQKLVASDGQQQDFFGASVSVSGTVALIGADASFTGRNGSAYVFRYDDFGATWTEEQKLVASDGQPDDGFGVSVVAVGTHALIGAPLDDLAEPDAGSVYWFQYSGNAWIEEDKLAASDGAGGDDFGFPVTFDGTVGLIGASLDDHDACVDAGAAYVFRLASGWAEEQKLLGDDCVITTDLQIVKNPDVWEVEVGDPITYTIQLNNLGPSPATEVEVTDLLAPELTFVSATPAQGSYDPVSGIWTVGEVPVGGPVTLEIVATVNEGADGVYVDNTASLSGLAEVDTNGGNDSQTVSVYVLLDPAPAQVNVMYGCTLDGALVQIDLATGAGMEVGYDPWHAWSTMGVFPDGRLVASQSYYDGGAICWMDAEDARTDCPWLVHEPYEAMAVSENGQLYGVADDPVGCSIWTYDMETGLDTYVDYFPDDQLSGIAFDPLDGTLWGCASFSGAIYTVELGSGYLNLVGISGFSQLAALEFDADGNLYAVDGDDRYTPSILVSIDRASGVGTYVNDTTFKGITDLALLANEPTAAPPGTVLPITVLGPIRPNPLRTRAVIRFELENADHVKLEVFDVSGRLVRSLLDRSLPAGSHRVELRTDGPSGRAMAPGVYFVRLRVGHDEEMRRMVVAR